MAERLDVTLRNDLSEIGRLTELLESFGKAHAFPPKLVFNVTLCLDELLTNIVSYAYEDGGAHDIHVGFELTGDHLRIVVEDDGKAFDPLKKDAADVESDVEDRQIGGLGIHFMRQIMDRLQYERDGRLNRLTMEARLDAGTVPAADGSEG